jgi:hypothetical protein
LALVDQAWPNLPKGVKSKFLAMIRWAAGVRDNGK